MGTVVEASNQGANVSIIEKNPAVVFVLATTITKPYPTRWGRLHGSNDVILGDLHCLTFFRSYSGGPGSGKGTQCANIVQQFGYTHLSAGDLLRAEIESGSENGTMIDNTIKEGQIVPSEVTIKLLQRAMQESGNDKFLIDGFPRNDENRVTFENVTGIEPAFVLFFDCPEEEMERRLLCRNQGRKDDNIDTIRKRFKVFLESSLPVIAYYDVKGKVCKIDAARPIEEVFESVKTIFEPKNEKAD